MRYGWDCLWSLVQWKCHQLLCQFLYDHQEGEKVPIPTKICPEDTNPLKVFGNQCVSMGGVCLVVETPPECLAMVSKH